MRKLTSILRNSIPALGLFLIIISLSLFSLYFIKDYKKERPKEEENAQLFREKVSNLSPTKHPVSQLVKGNWQLLCLVKEYTLKKNNFDLNKILSLDIQDYAHLMRQLESRHYLHIFFIDNNRIEKLISLNSTAFYIEGSAYSLTINNRKKTSEATCYNRNVSFLFEKDNKTISLVMGDE